MLKLRKIFSLGLMVAALGLMVSSCIEPVDYYSVTITSGDAETQDGGAPAWPGSGGAGTKYEEGDIVTIKAGTPPSGKVFYMWTSYQVDFDDPYSPTTKFTMPAEDVVVAAWYITALQPEVRYTWETVEQSKIQSIAASYNDVKYWLDEVYNKADYVEEDATAVPHFDGSDDIPDNIYSRTIGSTQYKGKYLPISEGQYTAVCTGEDALGIFDIVANYEIKVAGAYSYFEIAFDVGTFTDIDAGGDPETAWFKEVVDDPTISPRLEKAPVVGKSKVKKLTKKLENGGSVTYYFLRRAK